MNSTYWAPFTAHHTNTVQELLMGLISSSAQKVDLNMAPGTKHCKFLKYHFNLTLNLPGRRTPKVEIQPTKTFLVSLTRRPALFLFVSVSNYSASQPASQPDPALFSALK